MSFVPVTDRFSCKWHTKVLTYTVLSVFSWARTQNIWSAMLFRLHCSLWSLVNVMECSPSVLAVEWALRQTQFATSLLSNRSYDNFGGNLALMNLTCSYHTSHNFCLNENSTAGVCPWCSSPLFWKNDRSSRQTSTKMWTNNWKHIWKSKSDDATESEK